MTQDETIINPFVQPFILRRRTTCHSFYEEEMEALFETVAKDTKKDYGIALF